MASRRRRNLNEPTPPKTLWQRYQWYIIMGVALFFIVTVIVPAIAPGGEQPVSDDNDTPTDGTPSSTVPGEQFFPSTGFEHVPAGQLVTYRNEPPISGQHWNGPVPTSVGFAPVTSAPAPWDIYDQPIRDEILVHNMEHGGIVIHYRTTTAPSVVDELKEFVQQQPNFPAGYILAPRNILPTTISLSAWEWRLDINQFNEQIMSSFISAHYDEGRETIDGTPKP